MSKKTKTPATPAVVHHAEVSNNINLNLSQNDLIDLAIQEHLEKLEAKIKVLKTERDDIRDKIHNTEREFAEKIAKEILKDDPDYSKFLKALKILDLKITYPTQEEKKQGYHRYDPYRLSSGCNASDLQGSVLVYDDNQHYTNLSHVTRSAREVQFYLKHYHTLTIEINEGKRQDGITLQFYDTIALKPENTIELRRQMHSLEKREFEVAKELSDTQREFYEYTFGEKKVKAKIVKASLQRSAEGQAILGMLQGATGVKLIG